MHLLHPLPEAEGLTWIVASLSHHHQANVIGFGLLSSAHRTRENQVKHGISEPRCYEKPNAARQGDERVQKDIDAELRRHSFGDVFSQVVRDLVAQHGGHPVLVACDGDQPAEHENLAAGQDERVGLVRVVDDPDLPLRILHAADGNQAAHDLSNKPRPPVPVVEEAAAGALELPFYALRLRLARRPHLGLAVAVESPPSGHRNCLDVDIVEDA